MEHETIIVVSVFSAAIAVLLVLVVVLFAQVSSLRRRVNELQNRSGMRVQKLTVDNDKNHAFHNPAISPDEELAKRGFSMYAATTAAPAQDKDRDVESARGSERQTGGEFVAELSRELSQRQTKQQQEMQRTQEEQQKKDQDQWQQYQQKHQQQQVQKPPSFLLQSIQESKRRSNLANPIANGNARQLSETNPNFIY